MKTTLTLSLLLVGLFCKAQRQNVYFLKNNGKYVDVRDSADYTRVVREPDSASLLYNVLEFYKNGNKKLIGKSSAIDPPKFEGQCIKFYQSGKRESVTNYKNGLEVGNEFDFYTNGKMYLQKEYPDNADQYNDIKNNYLIIANFDSLGTVLVENGNGYFKGYGEGFKDVSEEGNVKSGKRDGLWKGAFKKMKVTFTENYKDGELINGTASFDDNKSTSYTKTRGTSPEFKGGLNAFNEYLSNNIVYPDDARENGTQGRVILSFVVEKDGKVTDIKVSKSVSSSLDAEAIRVIKNSSHWVPGTMFGRPVRVVYQVPVSFVLTN